MADAAAPPLSRGRRTLLKLFVFWRDIITSTLRDGYIHAGNIAYLSVVTLFPLVILIAAVAAAFGRTDAGGAAIEGLLRALPANIADLFEPVILEVLEAQTGNLLWIGGIVALWTVTTFIETLRDIIHRAYQAPRRHAFWHYRLYSMGATIVTMLFVLIAFLSQVVLVVAMRDFRSLVPYSVEIPAWVDLSQTVPPLLIFLSLWAIFKLLAPARNRRDPAWPGALVTTIAWIGGTLLLEPILARFGDMSITYGALSGVMVAMLFFYAVGFALVLGAELNAALATAADSPLRLATAADSPQRLAKTTAGP